MNKWNTTGKIKAILLVIVALPNLFAPMAVPVEQDLIMAVFPLIVGSLAIPLIAKLNAAFRGKEIVQPTWNDNPLDRKRTLDFFHFASYFFIAVGLSVLIGSAIKYQMFNLLGLTVISFGLGMLIGIWVTLKLMKRKNLREDGN